MYGNLKNCLMKLLKPLLYLMIVLLRHLTTFALDEKLKFNSQCLKQDKVAFTLKIK